MGLLDSLFGNRQTTATTTQSIPGYAEDFVRENLDIARAIGDRPYAAFPGQRIAGFTPDQTRAFALTRSNVGAYQPYLNMGRDAINQGMQGYDPALADTAGAYGEFYNPFIGTVADQVAGQLSRGNQQALNNIAARASGAGAYGGSRQGVAEAQAAERMTEAMGRAMSPLYMQGFDRAMGLAQNQEFQNQAALNRERESTLARQMQGGAALANMGSLAQQMNQFDVNSLLQQGALQQGVGQAGLDTAYSDFLRQDQYPIDMLQVRLGALGSSPLPTTTTTPYFYNPFLQGLGAAGTAAGAAGMLGWRPFG